MSGKRIGIGLLVLLAALAVKLPRAIERMQERRPAEAEPAFELSAEASAVLAGVASGAAGDCIDVKHFRAWRTGTVTSLEDPWVKVRLDPMHDDLSAADQTLFPHDLRPLPAGFAPRSLKIDPFGPRG